VRIGADHKSGTFKKSLRKKYPLPYFGTSPSEVCVSSAGSILFSTRKVQFTYNSE
jgi:hypothetical protein